MVPCIVRGAPFPAGAPIPELEPSGRRRLRASAGSAELRDGPVGVDVGSPQEIGAHGR